MPPYTTCLNYIDQIYQTDAYSYPELPAFAKTKQSCPNKKSTSGRSLWTLRVDFAASRDGCIWIISLARKEVIPCWEGARPPLVDVSLGCVHLPGDLKELGRLTSGEMEWRSREYAASTEYLKQVFDLYNSGDACSQRKETRNLFRRGCRLALLSPFLCPGPATGCNTSLLS